MHNTDIFNRNNRTSNSIKTSFWGVAKSVLDIILAFFYRTVFIHFLSAEYLGLNGLFTNILQVLSLAELGITTAIVFRFYKPISENDYVKVGKLMNYLKKVYSYIAVIILICGLSIAPFIKYFIKDETSIPSDVNLYFIYLLYLLNTVSSYLFVYKQNILTADQRGYIASIFGIAISIIKYTAQVLILIIFKNYSATLLVDIVFSMVLNYIFSKWTENKYKDVFNIKEELSKEDKNLILTDTKAVMFHKVGATVKLSTDSIILTKFASLVSAGIYSNYSMIITGLQTLVGQLLGNFVSSVGNAHVKLSKKENYTIYRKLLFIDFWISTVVVVCSYLVFNDFISVWAGSEYLFDKLTLIMLCLQFYILISRQINISYTNGCGLFTKDRFRPVIEAILNLALSIIGVQMWGILGVFVGTVVSSLLTVFWREPYILFKDEFEEPVHKYWTTYISFASLAILLCFVGDRLKDRFFVIDSFALVLIEAVVCFVITNVILFVITCRRDEFAFMKQLFEKLVHNKLLKLKK